MGHGRGFGQLSSRRGAGRLGEGGGDAIATQAATWVDELLACPRDFSPLRGDGGLLRCSEGHEYRDVDGVPVLVVEDVEATQPDYWASDEQIEAARRRFAGAEPPSDPDVVDPYVAETIIGTHGNLYRHLAGGLPRYPIPRFPLPPSVGRTLLDIGCNWGRWSIAATRAGYRVIGIDPSFEAILSARRIAQQLRADVTYVVADGRHLPFASGSLDVVFSYGVLQHFSKADVRVSIGEIERVLKPGGLSWVQMPNTYGLRSLYQLARRRFAEGEAFEVRYWRPAELRRDFGRIGSTTLSTDGFFTLNPQPSDLDLLPAKFRALVRASEALRRASRRLPLLTNAADSVNIRSVKPVG